MLMSINPHPYPCNNLHALRILATYYKVPIRLELLPNSSDPSERKLISTTVEEAFGLGGPSKTVKDRRFGPNCAR